MRQVLSLETLYPVLKNNTNHKYENRNEIYTKHGFFSRIIIGTCTFVLISLILIPVIIIQHVQAQPSILKDATLKVESVVSGLSSPTSMVFIDSNNILVLEKDGNVRLVSNGQLHSQPVLHVSVDVTSERGLLGIAVMNTSSISNNNNNKIQADDLPDEDVTRIDEIPVYSINKPKADSLVVLKILDNMKEGEGRPKMMKKGRLIEELEEVGIIDKNLSIGAKHSKLKGLLNPISIAGSDNPLVEVEYKGRQSNIILTTQGESTLKIFGQ